MRMSEQQKAIEQAFINFRSALCSILNKDDIKVDVDVKGVKLSSLAIIVEDGEGLDLDRINSTNDGEDRYYTEIDFEFGEIQLNTK